MFLSGDITCSSVVELVLGNPIRYPVCALIFAIFNNDIFLSLFPDEFSDLQSIYSFMLRFVIRLRWSRCMMRSPPLRSNWTCAHARKLSPRSDFLCVFTLFHFFDAWILFGIPSPPPLSFPDSFHFWLATILQEECVRQYNLDTEINCLKRRYKLMEAIEDDDYPILPHKLPTESSEDR